MEIVDIIVLILIVFFSAMILAVMCNRWLPDHSDVK